MRSLSTKFWRFEGKEISINRSDTPAQGTGNDGKLTGKIICSSGAQKISGKWDAMAEARKGWVA